MPGDYMVLRGLIRRPELNRRLVQVIGPIDGDRFAVTLGNWTNHQSVALKNLEHIRPPA